MGDPLGQPPGTRRDARRNRARLLAAARALFDEEGLDAPLDEVARRAGLGQGTLYRHFPTRDALITAIFNERLDEFVELLEAAARHDDPWDGFVWFVEALLSPFESDRLIREIFLRHPAGNQWRDRTAPMTELFEQLFARAKAAGALREDFERTDFSVMAWSFAPVMDATRKVAPDAWRRHLHWLLDGLRPEAATPQRQPPLTVPQMQTAARHLRVSN